MEESTFWAQDELCSGCKHLLLLQVMYFEAKGKLKEAEDLIAKMLSEHPDSHFAVKRQVKS